MEFLIWILAVLSFFLLLFFLSEKFRFVVKFFYLYVAYMFMANIIVLLCLPRPRHHSNGPLAAKIMKHINNVVGVQWELEGAQHLKKDSGAVVVLNHQSAIDVMAIFEIWPILEKAAPIAKKSLLYCGPFGIGCWLLGTVFIDRKSKNSRDDVNSAGKEALDKGVKLMIFPEGTRNSTKNLSLLPFKKGAFHVALGAKMPIIPVVISEYSFLDTKEMVFNPGKAVIRVLPPIDTSPYSRENLDDLVKLTRDQMLETLRELAVVQDKKEN